MTAEGARKFCKAVKPTKIEDLTAITAIYRPGPLKANVHNLFVDARKLDKIDLEYYSENLLIYGCSCRA